MRRQSVPAWFTGFLTCYRRELVVALALGCAASACAALLMFTSGYLISATALASTTLFSVMVPVACVQLFGIGRPGARYLERLTSHDWVLRVTSDLGVMLYRGIEGRTGDPARERAVGEYLGLLADDVAHLQSLYLRVVFPTVVAYLVAAGAALLFGFFSVPFALVMLVSLAVIAGAIPLVCLAGTRDRIRRARAGKAGEYAGLSDDVAGSTDWVLAGRGEQARLRHARSDQAVRAEESKVRLVQRFCSLAVTVMLAALACAVVIWAGSVFGDVGGNVNWIAAFALGFFPLFEVMAVLPAALSESSVHRISVRRLDEYVGDPGASSAGGHPSESGASASSSIRLSDVSYTYPGASAPALEGVSLELRAGSSVAVLGRSGAGKSTLVKVLSGALMPDVGEVCGCSPGNVGFVGQVPYLFNRTLRDNLTLGVAEACDERLSEVLASVGLGEKLAALPDGLDTVVGETGAGFSGGEAHRIAIARVLVTDAPVVVVDEPFSALDPETERDLLDVLLDTCAGRTLVLVTHHLACIERFDQVAFVEDGHIDLSGSPRDLMERSERFRELVSFDNARLGAF